MRSFKREGYATHRRRQSKNQEKSKAKSKAQKLRQNQGKSAPLNSKGPPPTSEGKSQIKFRPAPGVIFSMEPMIRMLPQSQRQKGCGTTVIHWHS
jgi:hypothetical protein